MTFDELLDHSVVVNRFFAEKVANGAFLPHVTQRDEPAVYHGDDFIEGLCMQRSQKPEARSQKANSKHKASTFAFWPLAPGFLPHQNGFPSVKKTCMRACVSPVASVFGVKLNPKSSRTGPSGV